MAKSSRQWLRRHVTDSYVKKAREQGYRSRAAFKLLEIDAREKIFHAGQTVVDLGAAPGGWSQVAAERVRPGGRVVAIDLLPIVPICGVSVLRGDFREKAPDALGGERVHVVLSDVSPNLSGIPSVDQARSLELSLAAIEFCWKGLKPEGVFVVKLFHGEAFAEIRTRLMHAFCSVKVIKPPASRGESAETYAVARRPRW